MDDLITEIGATLEHYAGQERESAAQMGCDAENWDGGSPETCEHCQAVAMAAHLEGLLSGLSASARLVRSTQTIEAWLQTKPRKSLEIFQSMAGFSVMPRQHDAAGRDYYADGFDDDDPGAAGPTLADALLALAARIQEPGHDA